MATIRKLGLKLALCTATLVLLAGLGASPALADDFTTYNLTIGNVGGMDCCTGPYVQVTIDLTDPTHATITFDSLTNGGYTYLLTHNAAADLNVNGSYTLSGESITNSFSGFTPGALLPPPSPGTVDGFGTFNLTLDNYDSFTHSGTEIEFALTNTSGTWSSAANVLTPNTDGNSIAAGVGACASPCSIDSTFGGNTGFVSGSTPVPEPATLTLLGIGLLGLGTKLRKKFIKK